MPKEAWREISVAEGGRGPRTYVFTARRARETHSGEPGRELWAIWRRNLDGSNPHCYLSNAPGDARLETLAFFSRSRWPVGTEIDAEQGNSGLDVYEACTWSGWHHRVDLCLLAGAFLLSQQQVVGQAIELASGIALSTSDATRLDAGLVTASVLPITSEASSLV